MPLHENDLDGVRKFFRRSAQALQNQSRGQEQVSSSAVTVDDSKPDSFSTNRLTRREFAKDMVVTGFAAAAARYGLLNILAPNRVASASRPIEDLASGERQTQETMTYTVESLPLSADELSRLEASAESSKEIDQNTIAYVVPVTLDNEAVAGLMNAHNLYELNSKAPLYLDGNNRKRDMTATGNLLGSVNPEFVNNSEFVYIVEREENGQMSVKVFLRIIKDTAVGSQPVPEGTLRGKVPDQNDAGGFRPIDVYPTQITKDGRTLDVTPEAIIVNDQLRRQIATGLSSENAQKVFNSVQNGDLIFIGIDQEGNLAYIVSESTVASIDTYFVFTTSDIPVEEQLPTPVANSAVEFASNQNLTISLVPTATGTPIPMPKDQLLLVSREGSENVSSAEVPAEVLSLASELKSRYNLQYDLEPKNSDGAYYFSSPYDAAGDYMFDPQGNLRHENRIPVEAMLPPALITEQVPQIEAQGFEVVWMEEFAGYGFTWRGTLNLNGKTYEARTNETWIFYPGNGTTERNGSYEESDLNHGWTRLSDGGITSSDYVPGVNGMKIDFVVGVNNPKVRTVGFDERIVKNQEPQDIVIHSFTNLYTISRGQHAIFNILDEDVSRDLKYNREDIPLDARVLDYFASGESKIGNTILARASMSTSLNQSRNYELYLPLESFGALQTILDEMQYGTERNNDQIPFTYADAGLEIFESLGITDRSEYFDYLVGTYK